MRRRDDILDVRITARKKIYMNFTDKVVYITGASSGIGRAAAIEYARRGAKISLIDINDEAALITQQLVHESGAESIFIHANVADYDQVKNSIKGTVNRFGKIDIALNNAGIGAKSSLKTAQHTLDDWDTVVKVNQTGLFYCMKEQLSHMAETSQGNIINVASIAGLRGLANQLAYVASKHAVVGMTKTAALEYARQGIRINAICPVFTNTPLLEMLFDSKDGLREKLVRTIPLGRYGEVSDIINAILWLSSDESSFITGMAMPIDGGQTA